MRLVYRKGTDLLVEVIHKCQLHPNVRFVIGGDGLKRVRLEEMREKSLQDKVEMLGLFTYSISLDFATAGKKENGREPTWDMVRAITKAIENASRCQSTTCISDLYRFILNGAVEEMFKKLSQMWGMGWQAVLLSYDHQFAMAAVGNDGRVDKTRE
ncbi:hypothetical protein HPP92_024140 [Vanilla planifolia]|uniref:Glycosyl transferase family 1 domain-containing protein n=1 Tax=Vanilla planifolia TaxID=51239 RepID=A0A835UCA7_VANPL|nr:hypothetical protein HPP92_024140 [Vanilla planifolia]